MAVKPKPQVQIIAPQPGYQTKVLSNPADIIISGSSAGVGKTFGLLLDPLRDINTPGFGAVIFRRTSPQITNQGGLWDTAQEVYPLIGGVPKVSNLSWDFPVGTRIRFTHLEYEKNIYDWQGAQIPCIGFDELTHFTKKMFFYLLTRNRSTCGVRPYMRCTCNPDPDSWVYELVRWYIDDITGLPIPERDGVVRYLMVDGENYIWGDTVQETLAKSAHLIANMPDYIDPKEFVKSFSFISGSIYDNKKLLSVNPAYLGNLLAQDEQTKAQLLYGNWKVQLSDKDIYDYISFLGLFDNIKEVRTSTPRKRITADIALEGSNKLVIGYWEDAELMNVFIMEKSDGPTVVAKIKEVASFYGVNNQDICYDADGVGGFIGGKTEGGGYIPGSLAFHGGSAAKEIKDPASGKFGKENYYNLRAQCYYRSGLAVARGDRKVNALVAQVMYSDKETMRQRFMNERKAIKKDEKTPDGKLKIISKDAMKAKLNGDSPDVMDMFMMFEMFFLKRTMTWAAM